VRIRDTQLPAAKVSNPDFEEKCGNSPDISKGISQSGMCKFESSQVSVGVVFELAYSRFCRRQRTALAQQTSLPPWMSEF
jgi:hypothetical protein